MRCDPVFPFQFAVCHRKNCCIRCEIYAGECTRPRSSICTRVLPCVLPVCVFQRHAGGLTFRSRYDFYAVERRRRCSCRKLPDICVRNDIVLTQLVPDLQQMVDEKKIIFSPAYQIAALTHKKQGFLLEGIDSE